MLAIRFERGKVLRHHSCFFFTDLIYILIKTENSIITFFLLIQYQSFEIQLKTNFYLYFSFIAGKKSLIDVQRSYLVFSFLWWRKTGMSRTGHNVVRNFNVSRRIKEVILCVGICVVSEGYFFTSLSSHLMAKKQVPSRIMQLFLVVPSKKYLHSYKIRITTLNRVLLEHKIYRHLHAILF